MTPPQVVAAIAAVAVPSIIPTVAVVISILRSDSKIDALSTRIDAKIDALSARTDARFDALSARTDAKIDGLRSDLRSDMSILDNIAYEHHGRLARLETRANPEPQ